MDIDVKKAKCAVCQKESSQKYFAPFKYEENAPLQEKVKNLEAQISFIPLQKCPYCDYINTDIEKNILMDIASIVRTPEYIAHTEEDLDPETYYYDYLDKAQPATPETYAVLASKAELYRQASISLFNASERIKCAQSDFMSDLEGEKLDVTDKEFYSALDERKKLDLKLALGFIDKHLEEHADDYVAKCAKLNILKTMYNKVNSKITALYNEIANDAFVSEEIKALAKKIITFETK